MSTIESELDDQVAFLRRDTTIWRRGVPKAVDEACMVIRIESAQTTTAGWFMRQLLSQPAQSWLNGFMDRIGLGVSATTWNDTVATSKDQVIAHLEKAVAAAGEAGV